VRFALEDQLAGAPEDSHLALAAQAADGTLRVAIVANAWMRSFTAASARSGLTWRRIIVESVSDRTCRTLPIRVDAWGNPFEEGQDLRWREGRADRDVRLAISGSRSPVGTGRQENR
jgi:hypothetical protein